MSSLWKDISVTPTKRTGATCVVLFLLLYSLSDGFLKIHTLGKDYVLSLDKSVWTNKLIAQHASEIDYPLPLGKTVWTNEVIRLPPIAERPSLRRPFIFFHIPKCGGTTLRTVFHDAAEAAGIDRVFACFDGLPCLLNEKKATVAGLSENISPPRFGAPLVRKFSCASVLAAHFTVDIVHRLAELDRASAENVDNALCDRGWNSGGIQYDCFVSIREPISQFVSNYYQEIFTGKNKLLDPAAFYEGKVLKDLSPEQLTSLIRNKDVLNNKMSYFLSGKDRQVGKGNRRLSNYDWDKELRLAEGQLSRCVVGVLEKWDLSTALLEAAVPWIGGEGAASEVEAKHVAPDKSFHETIEDLSFESANTLRSLLQSDISLYMRGLDIFRSQLRQYEIKDVVDGAGEV
mmetsp:Transcript_41105/g.80450  ORF Transcript_41105/g.80450 Transcript_41105/m.80450 type:complete len:402 (+) Transcript_41105:77-1282(+)